MGSPSPYLYGLGSTGGVDWDTLDAFRAKELDQQAQQAAIELAANRAKTLAALPPEYRRGMDVSLPPDTTPAIETHPAAALPPIETHPTFHGMVDDTFDPTRGMDVLRGGAPKYRGPIVRDALPDLPPSRLDWNFSGLAPGERPLTDSTIVDDNPATRERIQAHESTGGGGFSPSQTDWSKVANPMAFEAYRELPGIAGREATISRANALARDPFAEDRAKVGQALDVYRGQRAIDTAEMEQRRQAFEGDASQLRTAAEQKIAAIKGGTLPEIDKQKAIGEVTSRLQDLLEEAQQSHGFAKQAKADPFAGLGKR